VAPGAKRQAQVLERQRFVGVRLAEGQLEFQPGAFEEIARLVEEGFDDGAAVFIPEPGAGERKGVQQKAPQGGFQIAGD